MPRSSGSTAASGSSPNDGLPGLTCAHALRDPTWRLATIQVFVLNADLLHAALFVSEVQRERRLIDLTVMAIRRRRGRLQRRRRHRGAGHGEDRSAGNG